MSTFAILDGLIVDAIKSGRTKFNDIFSDEVSKRAYYDRPRDGYRLVDRRLQALRKRGAIAFNKGEWTVCAHEAGRVT
ncbi:hypothetical protein [Luteimonas saliphila]|uniref:hypothetical protein n=1 Tax=Luteimonas saliphila TaxID=2804919 RepID=UPI00192DEB61|nr:hypothetical protein [Luteimonas saliphila]